MTASVSLILAAWIALATAAISPGPNLVAVASRALGSGRASALMVALGLSVGAVWTCHIFVPPRLLV